MEYRKLISFGKSSYVISLPKPWVRQNKLQKGDLIYLEESGPNLLVSMKELNNSWEENESVINIDGKGTKLIEREVNSAYISNCRTIILKGKEVKSKIKELQSVIQNLIALETMEQTSDSILAKDFLNMNKVSLNELIKKMDILTRTMLTESCNIFNDDNYENINDRDKDVNRLYFLIYRTVLYNLNNPMKALKNFKLTPVDLFKIHRLGFYIEGIADEARRSARFARKIQLNAQKRENVEKLLEEINQYYRDTMKALYNNNSEKGYKLSEIKKLLNYELDKLEIKGKNVESFVTMISRLRRMISHIHNLGRLTYTSI